MTESENLAEADRLFTEGMRLIEQANDLLEPIVRPYFAPDVSRSAIEAMLNRMHSGSFWRSELRTHLYRTYGK